MDLDIIPPEYQVNDIKCKIKNRQKLLLDIIVCDINYKYMISDYDLSRVRERPCLMFSEWEEIDTMPDKITFKQWMSTDRMELVTTIKPEINFLSVNWEAYCIFF